MSTENCMLEELKISVCKANLDLVKHGLVIHTWGNASGRDRKSGLIVIKPSGVSYSSIKPSDMVVIDMEGRVVEGKYRPSTDAATHIVLYKVFGNAGAVVHTHSTYATAWAQAGSEIPALGTTHADHYYGSVPCTRKLRKSEVEKDYEINTGKVIAERMKNIDPEAVPSVLVHSHGSFTWGSDTDEAVYNAVALEEIARLAFYTVLLGRKEPVDKYLLDKHYGRKHGSNSYYGQGRK